MANVQLLISVWTIGPVFWWKIYLTKCSYGSWNRNWYTLRLLWFHATRVYQYMPTTVDGSLRLVECQFHFCSSYKVTFLISTETSMAGPKNAVRWGWQTTRVDVRPTMLCCFGHGEDIGEHSDRTIFVHVRWFCFIIILLVFNVYLFIFFFFFFSFGNKTDGPISTEHCDWLYGIFGHETSCTRYWTCWNGTATEQLCIGGLLYNENAHSCDWPENVDGCQKHRKYCYWTPLTLYYQITKFISSD